MRERLYQRRSGSVETIEGVYYETKTRTTFILEFARRVYFKRNGTLKGFGKIARFYNSDWKPKIKSPDSYKRIWSKTDPINLFLNNGYCLDLYTRRIALLMGFETAAISELEKTYITNDETVVKETALVYRNGYISAVQEVTK